MEPSARVKHTGGANVIQGIGAKTGRTGARGGGPTQPEMSSFKSVNSKDMVNLFTGDFSYNIPLLDVGGYPVNIYYNGEIGMEQEASWVGLGWNINPGSITRNVRGIPDDFDGSEQMIQQQNVKPNQTYGITVGPDVEWNGLSVGSSVTAGFSIGVSWNNYLGPALNTGIQGGIQFQIADKALSEKGFLNLGGGISANIGSRSGFSLSPNMSLTANIFTNNRTFSGGASLSTTYNSREGIKALQISEQVSANRYSELCALDPVWMDINTTARMNSNLSLVHSSSISFARPSYTPMIRVPMVNTNGTGQFQLGSGIFGGYFAGEGEVFSQQSYVDHSAITQTKQMVGYLFYDKAKANPDWVTDFTRFNDREVTPNTPIISAPQYTYDVFTIQGEGTGGSIRPYRNDLGSVRDNFTGSKDVASGVGLDIGPPGHYGFNVNQVRTPATIGEWTNGNTLTTAMGFDGTAANGSYENVYFRNPGEGSVLDNNAYTRIGGTDLVRFHLMGDGHNPGITTSLDRFAADGSSNGTASPATYQLSSARPREKRSQVVDFLDATDASVVGLDKNLYSYSPGLDANNMLIANPINRVNSYRLGHHISQISVTESSGKRYVYGLPVYNITQSDYTFTVNGTQTGDADTKDEVNYDPINDVNPTGNVAVNGGNDRDGYVSISTTPGYAHSFLLTGLLSPDYVDVTGDGITEDDLGQAVKFNYTQFQNHNWRTPYGFDAGGNPQANFNPGNHTNLKDDKGMITFGTRESLYLHSIESKNLIAIFTLKDRDDGKGVIDVKGQRDNNDVSVKALDHIDLYSKSDLRQHGIGGANGARPIKTVHFVYDYLLCPGTPDNINGGGKLTLESIYFTYNGQEGKTDKEQYVFSYANNPAHTLNASDRWGTYKPAGMNPDGVKNSDFPYTPQDQFVQGESGGPVSPKATVDANAGAWSLNKILLPSGGQLEIGYESDDYAYVQNARATDMLSIAGFGFTTSDMSNTLYDINPALSGIYKEKLYLFINVPVACTSTQDVYYKYLQGITQMAVKLDVGMPAGNERVTSYATIDYSNAAHPDLSTGSYGVTTTNPNVIWVKLKPVNGYSPLSLTALEYLREQLPAQAYPGYDVSGQPSLEQVVDILKGWLNSLTTAFSDPVHALMSQGMAQTVQLSQCFARLNDPDGHKYGGGQRVNKITLKDNWNAMTGQFTSSYTQTYDYTTTETLQGATRSISSGVATYEPTIGGDENPFQTIVQVADKLPMGPVNYGAVEMPVLDAFFPAPVVGYSQVTVQSLSSTPATTGTKSRSGIGRQVTKFYTSKDFPVYYTHTGLDPSTDYEAHDASTTDFFYKYAFDARALSQGFLVTTNDMNGKMQSQASYADNDPTQLVNSTEYYYRNTGSNGLSETFPFVSSKQGGVITQGNMGVDIELMTDTREFIVKSSSVDVQAQADMYPVIGPDWLPFIWGISGNSENDYRAVTTTKVVNYHAVLDSVVVYDKGSKVSTKNLLYDGETGQVITTRTINEFNQPVYSTSYPAWWAYDGMGPAYINIGVQYTASSTPFNFTNGVLVGSGFDLSNLVSGDELLVTSQTPMAPICPAIASREVHLWVMDLNKNNPPFPTTTPNFIFIDKDGNPYNNTNVTAVRIIRSGRRNMLDDKVAMVTSLVNPILTNGSVQTLSLGSLSAVLNATAVEYSEKWQTDKDEIPTYRSVFDQNSCTSTLVVDCGGQLETAINPYRKGLLGTFRVSRNMVFYGNRNNSNTGLNVNLSSDGYLANFGLYWDFNGAGLVPNTSSTSWIESNRVNRVNAQGLELETMNALGIYTAAQYGFNKTLPLAITNNSPVSHAAYAGFEDYGFNQGVDGFQPYPCSTEPIDFADMPGAHVANTDTMSFHAHTGHNVLQVGSGGASVQVPITSTDPLTYALQFGSNTSKVLNDPGGNLNSISVYPSTVGSGNSTLQSVIIPQSLSFGGGTSMTLDCAMQDTAIYNASANSTHLEGDFDMTTSQWMQITQPGNYTVTMSTRDGSSGGNGNTSMNMTITDANGNFVASPQAPNALGGLGAQTTTTVWLCPGYYQVSCELDNEWAMDQPGNWPLGIGFTYLWSYSINSSSGTYKTLSTQNGCTSTTAIPGAAAMLNPLFSMPANTPMLLSAWVHETPQLLSSGADSSSGWYHNKISLSGIAGQPTDFYPTGPLIDGWQRYEAKFTPGASGSVNISFTNTSGSPIYFDDIRVHPFNAEMKGYVYDPVSLRLVAELDENNYATFYDYDEEGTPVRTKAETQRGIQTIKETRSAKQKNINTAQ